MNSERLYQIALTLIPGVGDVVGKKLIAHCGSAEAVFLENKKALDQIDGIGTKLTEAIKQANTLKRAEEEILFIEQNGINLLFFTDKEYPFRLKQCADSPLIIYFKGNPQFNAERIISVVGTRTASKEGIHFCNRLVEDLARYRATVVSGLAYGIDVCAHKAALKNNIPTWAVLAHGLDRIYPPAHAQIAKMMQENGALITDFMSNTKPDKQNFPSRNRIVAGLSEATIVVESNKKGGSLITAEIANSYNREVFAVPGSPKNIKSSGCNHLIKTQKAILLENIEDIVRELNWDLQEKKISKSIQNTALLTAEEKALLAVLKTDGMHVDCIVEQLGWNTSMVAQTLLKLELVELIAALPGKRYKKYD